MAEILVGLLLVGLLVGVWFAGKSTSTRRTAAATTPASVAPVAGTTTPPAPAATSPGRKKIFWWSAAGVATLVLVIGYWLGSGKGTGGPGGQPPPVHEVNPRIASTCQNVSDIPWGMTGDFCANLQPGAVQLVKPPPSTWTEVSLGVAGEIKFFDWFGKEVGLPVQIAGPDDFPCFPKGWSTFSVKLKAAGTVRVRVGGTRSHEFLGKCS